MAYQFKASIVRILNKRGEAVGAGFLASERHVFTCAHVVAQALRLPKDTMQAPAEEVLMDFPLISPGSEKLVGHVSLWRPVSMKLKQGSDIALLELKTNPPANSQSAYLVTGEDDLWGHSFRAFGFPEGFDIGEWAGGIIRDKLANGWVVIEADKESAFFAEQGFSGTPVWDDTAKGTVGMIAAVEFQSSIKVGYFIPTEILVETWPEIEKYARPPCPYRGLLAFKEEHASFFFGRENFVKKLIDALQKKPLIAVIGPSGSGKSSSVFAGLIHYLRKEKTWLIASFHPGKHPFDNLAFNLIPLMEAHMNEADLWIKGRELAELFRNEKGALQDFIERIIEKNTSASSLLLVADQFEELFTLCQDEQERNLFLDKLLGAVRTESAKPGTGLTFLFIMRTDFLNHALLYKNLAEVLQYDVLTLGPMNYQEQKYAIVNPAQRLKVKIENGLTERILGEVSQTSGNLPLLEFALTQMWEKQTNCRLTHAAYDEIGGVKKALSDYAENEYSRFSTEDQLKIYKIFIQLVHPGKGIEDMRRLATRTEVGEDNWDLVTQLADTRLVITDRDKVTGEETVEIVHEALIKGWNRLHKWIEQDRIFRLWQERLRLLIYQWETKKFDEGALLRGSLLAEAEDWLQKRPLDLSKREQAFIRKSKSVDKQRQRRKTIGIAIGVTTVLTFAVLAAIGWWHASKERNHAEKQRQVALARQLVAQAELTRNQQPNLLPFSALLAVEAMKRSPSLEADQALRHSLTLLPRGIAQLKHNGSVTAAAFSPDKRYLATVCKDQTIQIWDTDNYESINTIKHLLPVNMVAFSPDGSLFAVASSDNEIIRIYKVSDGKEIATMKHDNNLTGIAFSPDGRYLGSASWDHTARIWEAKTGEKLFTLGHDNKVTGITFTPDGSYVGTSGWDHTARVWDADNGEEILRLEHVNRVTGITFSPNGAYVATSGWDHTARVWDADNGEEKIRVRHSDNLNSFIFSIDNQYLVTASKDGTARIWEVRSGKEVIRISHSDEVNTVVLSPNGRYLATTGSDNIAQIWEASSFCIENRMVHDDEVKTAIFSPDGKYLATVSKDRTAGLWDADNCKKIATLRHCWEISDVSFSPDAKFLATAGMDSVVRVWEIQNSREAGLLEHQDAVKKVVFSPDGRYLATVCENHTSHIWDMLNGEKIKNITAEYALNDLEFSPDGRFIAAACKDHMARLWDVKEGMVPSQMAHTGEVTSITFSPDGRFIATACIDHMVRLWDVKEGMVPSQMPHTDEVTSITFSPDGRFIATACIDHMARLWDVKEGNVINQIKHTDEVTSIAFSPDGRFIATACIDRSARLWDAGSLDKTGGNKTAQISGGSGCPQIACMMHEWEITNAIFSPDGKSVATAGKDHAVYIWKTTDPLEVYRIKHKESINALGFSPDGKYIVTACADGKARVYDSKNYQKIVQKKHEAGVNIIAISPKENYAATVSGDGSAKVWNVSNGNEIAHITFEPGIYNLSFSPNGQYLATVNEDRTIKIWEVKSWKKVSSIIHKYYILDIAFSPHGEYLATTDNLKTAQIWSIVTGEKIISIKHMKKINAIKFSKDGRYIVTACEDRGAHIWEIITGKEIARLNHEQSVNYVEIDSTGRYLITASSDHTARKWLWQPKDMIIQACAHINRNLTPEEWLQYLGNEPYCKTCPDLP